MENQNHKASNLPENEKFRDPKSTENQQFGQSNDQLPKTNSGQTSTSDDEFSEATSYENHNDGKQIDPVGEISSEEDLRDSDLFGDDKSDRGYGEVTNVSATNTEDTELPENQSQSMLTGMFSDRESTENAFNTMQERGYSKEEISLIMSDDTHNRHFGKDPEETELGNKAAENAGKGSAIGGTLGAIGGVIAAIGTSLVLPGLGLVIAGPIAAGLAGAGAGGLAGGIIGALVGSGIPADRAKEYESGVKSGNIVMGVKPRNDDDAKFFQENWKTNKGQDIKY